MADSKSSKESVGRSGFMMPTLTEPEIFKNLEILLTAIKLLPKRPLRLMQLKAKILLDKVGKGFVEAFDDTQND